MSLRFVFGASGAGKSTYLQKEIIEKSMADNGKEYVFLVPDQFTMQVQKDIVCMHPRKGIMNIDVLSFGRLYYRVMEEVGKKEQLLLDDTGKNLILRHLALSMEAELPVIGSSMKKVGYIHEVKSVISEFMQYGISPKDVEKIMDTAKDKPVLCGKLADVKKLYEAFLQYLGDKYLTMEETLDQLAMALSSSKHFRGSVFVLDGFTGFTPVQNRVVRALLQICEEVIVVITKEGESDLFDLSRKTVASLEKIAKEENVARGQDIVLEEKPVARLKGTRELAFLEENIFRNYGVVYNAGTSDEISVFVADTPREEMRRVCLEIRKLVKEKQYSYRDIAVVCGDLEQYGTYGAEMFSLYEIPAFIDNNRKLLLNPFTEFLKGGLLVILKDYSYESVMHFLKSGFTGISMEEIDILENYLLALGIHGKNRWGRKFVRYPAYMNKDLDALEAVNVIRQKVLDILEPIRKIEKLATADAKTEAVYEFIVKNQVFERLEQQREIFASRGDYAREKEYGQLYTYVMQLLEQMASLLEGEEVSLEEYIRILEAGLTELSIGVLPQGVDYVLLGDIERSRLGNNIKALFFVGCNDGIIPKANAGGGIISDFDREFLLEEGYELSPSPRQKMQMQRLYLYMNMTKPKEHLYLSYARLDGEGKSLRPSYLIDLVKEMFPGIRPEDFSEAGVRDRICGTKDAGEYLADLLRLYADDMLLPEEESYFYALYHHLQGVDKELVESLTDAAFYQYEPKRLGKAVCRQIYGAVLATSISKLEQYATCAYAHFLEYGMHLKEKERYAFESMDMGNIFHQVLQMFSLKLKEKQLDWRTFTEEDGRILLGEVLQNVTADYRESVLYQNGETTYAIMRMQRILERAIFRLQYQIKKGGFNPEAVEVEFKNVISLKDRQIKADPDGEEEELVIRGKIDRLDTCRKGNKLYVKVVDYKSGEKKIDLVQLYQGTQLQLVIYLDQAVQKVKEELQKSGNASEVEVVPAAMFYYPVTDPMRDESTREAAEKDLELWLRKKLRQSGLYQEDSEIIQLLDGGDTNVVSEPKENRSYSSDVIRYECNKDGTMAKRGNDAITATDLSTVMKYANWKVAEIGRDICAGNKAIAPRSKEACIYCNFREICEFDIQTRGFSKPKEQEMKKEDVLAAMEEMLGQDRPEE